MAPVPACLVLERLSRTFGGLTAVDRVDLVVAAGERRALIGPNGAGKTTLFNLISGELEPTSGRIKVFGVDVSGMRPHRRAALGVARTFQMTRLFPNLTVVENVLLACEGLDRRKFVVHRRLASIGDIGQRAAGLLAEFGLSQVRDELAQQPGRGFRQRRGVRRARRYAHAFLGVHGSKPSGGRLGSKPWGPALAAFLGLVQRDVGCV